MTFVVDASLAIKWLVREEGSAEAWRFADYFAGDLRAPDLIHIEVLGALVRLANERRMMRPVALERITWWTTACDNGAIVTQPLTLSLAGEAAALAIDLGHPIKDCLYLALADRLGCPLVTCDVKFHERVADPARVRLLADLA